MKIIGDTRLLISGILSTCIVVIFCCTAVVCIHTYNLASSEVKLASKFIFGLSGVCVCLLNCYHLNTWYISYCFTEYQITIQNGVCKKYIEYDAKLFTYAKIISNNDLAFPLSKSRFLILSIQPLSLTNLRSINYLRNDSGKIVIRLSSGNCKKLNMLLQLYPSAPYASVIRRVLS